MRSFKKYKKTLLLALLPLSAVCGDMFTDKSNNNENAKGQYKCKKNHTAPFGDGVCTETGCSCSQKLPP